ncbi:protein of unknown function [Roseivivax lentus]|uniref:Uncharacterized protein n=1 Tax=Roseivivax lentus TaxID=633194 RepID=A0A1N7LEJ5_9RHOB|nr:Abi-alpha family protein [Roseivivax lentus]SIS72213.1 protein of unknown function [Roseivivax lentus]
MNDDDGSQDSLANNLSPIALDVAKAATGGLLAGISDSSGDVWGALIGDRLKAWRYRNWVNGLEKTADHIRQKGVNLNDARQLPNGDMLVLFDGISKEEDEDLSDMWARLIAEEMTEGETASLSARSVASVIEQMSPASARVFLLLSKEEKLENITRKLNAFGAKELFPLSAEEEKIDEEALKKELTGLKLELKNKWDRIHESSELVEANLEIAKAELMRLNLIERKEIPVYFDSNPFHDGFKLDAPSLDSVIEKLQEQVKELVDSRTLSGKHPFLDKLYGGKGTNFRLSISGKVIAKKLALI